MSLAVFAVGCAVNMALTCVGMCTVLATLREPWWLWPIAFPLMLAQHLQFPVAECPLPIAWLLNGLFYGVIWWFAWRMWRLMRRRSE